MALDLYSKIYRRVNYKWMNKMPYERRIVFGVGVSKTATTSLAEALRILGYKVFDNPPIVKVHEGSLEMEWPWWVRDGDAMTDLSVAAVTHKLVELFPNALFIYTSRAMEPWLRSCRSHFTPELAEARIKQGSGWMNQLSEAFYGSATFDDADMFRQAYISHEERVHRIVPRNRLLSVDLTKSPRWDEICEFLGKPVPETAFPHSNIGNYRKQ